MYDILRAILVDGVGVQALLATVIWAVIGWQVLHGLQPSDFLVGAGGTVLGYYFRTLAHQQYNGKTSGLTDKG